MAEPEQNPDRDPVSVLLAGVREFVRTRDEQTGRQVLVAMVEEYLAALSGDDFAALVEEVREPVDTGPAYPASWGQKPRN